MDTKKRAILGDYPKFLRFILDRLTKAGFDLTDFVQLDHICYRTTSLDNYQQKRTELASIARLLGETQIAGRPIATFRLHQPIMYERWRIDAIELPAPKPNSRYPEGLEHVEFVLYDDLPTFMEKHKDQPFEKHTVNGLNPAVDLQLGEYAVKFHLLSLPAVVYLEQYHAQSGLINLSN